MHNHANNVHCLPAAPAQVNTNHAVDLVIIGDEGTSVPAFEVAANKGKNTICLPGSGSFILTPRGCYIFSSKSYPVTVSPDAVAPPLQLTANRAYVDGVIRVLPSSSGDAASASFPGAIEIGTITAEPADSVAEAGVVATATQLNPETAPGLYSYTLSLDLGSTVMIEPVQPDGGALLFMPARTRYQLVHGTKGCPDAIPEIKAHEGVIVSGQTDPAVSGGVLCAVH